MILVILIIILLWSRHILCCTKLLTVKYCFDIAFISEFNKNKIYASYFYFFLMKQ